MAVENNDVTVGGVKLLRNVPGLVLNNLLKIFIWQHLLYWLAVEVLGVDLHGLLSLLLQIVQSAQSLLVALA